MDIKRAMFLIESLVEGDYGPEYSEALQTLRTAVLAQQTNNKQSTPLQSCVNCGSETCGMRAGFCANWFPK